MTSSVIWLVWIFASGAAFGMLACIAVWLRHWSRLFRRLAPLADYADALLGQAQQPDGGGEGETDVPA